MIVWLLLTFVMWGWAIIGPVYLLFGAIYFLLDADWVSIPGPTAEDKLANLGVAAFLGAVGISFAWLRWRKYLKFADRD